MPTAGDLSMAIRRAGGFSVQASRLKKMPPEGGKFFTQGEAYSGLVPPVAVNDGTFAPGTEPFGLDWSFA